MKETVKEVGKLQLSVSFEYSDWKKVYERYTVSCLGQMHYFKPFTATEKSRLDKAWKELTLQYLQEQSPVIPPDISLLTSV